LQALPGVAAVSAASSTPANYIDNENPFRLSIETDEENRQGSALVGTLPDYFDVMHIRILQGEAFSQSSENKDVAILSKAAAEMLHVSDIVGKRIYQSMTEKDYTVIGIADDVQYRSLREKMTPVIYVSNFNNYQKIVIRLNKGNHINTIAAIEKCWQSVAPDVPFDFTYFDTKLQNNYRNEISQMKLLNMLVIISILISSLGIFGLIIEILVQRTKEIGIRKVNGARTAEVMLMLNRDFIKWVVIAFVVACPIAWYAMYKWLENFAFKTSLSWWVFAIAGATALFIALLTVSWQSWRAATKNPVESLRYE
jgi:putative ABC transport system permease protein